MPPGPSLKSTDFATVDGLTHVPFGFPSLDLRLHRAGVLTHRVITTRPTKTTPQNTKETGMLGAASKTL
jgi:hypothetical protein